MKTIGVLGLLFIYSQLLAQTYVSGGIFSNTTWTKANSPYIVTGSVAVFPGNKLTVEPGVEIRFDTATFLEVREGASIFANGLFNDSIIFTSNLPSTRSVHWQGLKLNFAYDSIELSFIEISYAVRGIDGLTQGNSSVENCRFYRNTTAILNLRYQELKRCDFIENQSGIIYSGYSRIEDCNFIGNSYQGINSNSTKDVIKNSFFCANFIGINELDSIVSCQFVKNEFGIMGDFEVISDCIFSFNDVGINSEIYYDTIIRTDIFNNRIGWKFDHSVGGYFDSVNICSNTEYNVVKTQNTATDLKNICWCETDSSKIAAKIYDGFDDVNLGLVDFNPIVNCSINALPPNPDTSCADFLIGIGPNEVGYPSVLTIYPNPGNSNMNFEGMNPGSLVKVFSQTGQLLFELTANESKALTLDISSWLNGIYLYTVIDSSGSKLSGKFIVQH